ncbi:MAG: hypothetical protein K0Q43_376 [Ramlibacter sp.]|nr:hypothetical protein [Ramlibacter sp.]
MLPLDHILWTVPDLQSGISLFEQMTGVRAGIGGRHPGRGTQNALASFGEGCYLEIVAPDPAQPLENNYGAIVHARQAPGLITFVMRCTDMAPVASAAARLGLPWDGPNPCSRQRPDGEFLHWRLGFTEGSAFGDYLPYYIDWQDTPHPSETAPGGLQLLEFEVIHPKADELRAIYRELGIAVPVRRALQPGMRALVACPAGQIVLTSLL